MTIKRLWLLLPLLAACSENDFLQPAADSDPMELRAEISQQYTTRASDGGFADGDQIGVFIVNYDDAGESAGGDLQSPTLQPKGNHADNVRFTYDEATGRWTGSYQLYWKDKKTPVDAYGYYPFDADISSTQAYPFSVQQNQRDRMTTGRRLTGYEQSDFLWAKKEGVIPTSGAVTLRHQHIMAGVKVILEEGQGFDEGEWDDIDKTVLLENTITEGTINLQTGIATPSTTSAPKVITPLPAEGGAGGGASAGGASGSGTVLRLCTYPQTIAAQKTLFSFTIDGKSYTFARQEAMTFQAGKLHQFTFSVQKSLEKGDYLVSLTGLTVTPWDNDPVSHDGAAREYITVNVEEGEYLGDVIGRMGLDPKEIVNLKLTGTIVGNRSFEYIRKDMPYIEALNLKELRTRDITVRRWEGGWGETPYGLPVVADDWLPSMYGMYFLSYVVWPDSMKGVCSFSACNLRGSLIFPEGLEYIDGDFGGTTGFYDSQTQALSGELYIPSTVKYIADGAFKNTALHGEVILPERMIYIGGEAFAGCEFLTGQIHIPEGLDVVNGFCAPNMTAKVVNIPQGVKTVNGMGGQPAGIIFPEGVEEINTLFGGSSQPWQRLDQARKCLRYVKLPSTLRRLGGWAFAGTGIQHVDIPEGIEIIPGYAFGQCDLQDTLTIPSTVQRIDEQAFYACNKLNAVVLPGNLGEIRDFAFCDCRSLYYIRCLNPEPPKLSGSAFNGVEKNECALVVPEGSVEAYRNADGWKEFKRISTYQNFVCRPMRAKLLNKAGTRTVVLNADGPWQLTHKPEWASVSPASGNKKTELTVKIDAMPHGSADRRDSLVFTLTDKTTADGKPIACYYGIEQFDYEYDEDSQAQLQKATRGKGINIVFLGDGYDAEDIARGTFMEDMKEGMEYFFAVEPYQTYKDYFNVYCDFAMSYESGVCSSVDIWRQTKFSTTYGSGDNGRLGIQADDVMGYVLNDVSGSSVTAANVDQSLIVCVPNSDAYEGICTLYSSGAAVAFCPHSRYSYPNDYRGIIQHEAGGHGFGKLGDEYIYHRDNIWTCPCICCGHADAVSSAKALGWYRNLSLDGKYGTNEWRHLIFHPQYGDIVDLYEGGHMHGRDIYRPEVNSCMNNNVPYYNTPSRQAIVERIKQYAGETFSFDDFVSHDSRLMGEKFLTRSGHNGGEAAVGDLQSPTAMHGHAPVIRQGSPLDYIKKKGGKR